MKLLRLLCLVLPLTLIAAGFTSEPEKVNELNKSLLQAAAKGDIAQVKSLLSKGADVNAKDKFAAPRFYLLDGPAVADPRKQSPRRPGRF